MSVSAKNILLKNPGLRLVALLLAILVWAMITGRERSYSERNIEINVEYFDVARNIAVRTVNPDKVRIRIRATSKELEKITPDDFKLRIDLKRISETTRVNIFTEDELEYPEDIEIISIHPKMIEITATEMVTREVSVRVRYRGKLKPGIILKDRRVVPEKVQILGYKAQVEAIDMVEPEVNLGEIEESGVIRLRLKKDKDIIKFVDTDIVEVHITVINKNKPVIQPDEDPDTKNETEKN